MINAEIIAHSKNYRGDELVSFILTFPRIILPEVLTHRMFSRNTSSSRAIPFEKMIEVVKNNPFIPVAFQKKHKGMQGYEYFGLENFNENRPSDWHEFDCDEEDVSYDEAIRTEWKLYRDEAVENAIRLNSLGVTKQLCNRLLEPFMWCTMLVTTSTEGLFNFFDLRCPKFEYYENCDKDGKESRVYYSRKQLMKSTVSGNPYSTDMKTDLDWLKVSKSTAEIHIQLLAEKMYDAYIESEPKNILPGEWHIPFIKQIFNEYPQADLNEKIQIATSMAARVSYTTIEEGKKISIEKHKELYQLLIDEKHSSPLEHCAKALFYFDYEDFVRKELPANPKGEESLTNIGWCDNFKGFIPLRRTLKF